MGISIFPQQDNLIQLANILTRNIGNFNGTTVAIQDDGEYWMHLSITVPPLSSVLFTLLGVANYFKIVQTHNGFYEKYLTSRNGAVNINAGMQLSLFSKFLTGYIRWFFFRLDNCFSPIVVFQVARNSSAKNLKYNQELITFDVVLMNIGSAWNASANSFIAPQSGLYFFSLNAGMSGNKTLFAVDFVVNKVAVQRTESGYNQLSVSKLLFLNYGDTFNIISYGNLYNNQIAFQTSLAGFYYNPLMISKVW